MDNLETKYIKIIVPCYNEEGCIYELYKRVKAVFQNVTGYKWKILFVDDGSKDHTLQQILKIIQCETSGEDEIEYISFARNFGKEAAIFAGLSNSLDADMVALMDADLQHPPELLPKMIHEVETEYDCCGAKRVTRTGEPLLRSVFSRLFYKFINRVTSMKLVSGGSDYRVMSKKFVKAVLSLPETERFTKGILSWVGFNTKWIEYDNEERFAGQTKWSFIGLIKYAVNGFFAFAVTPLRVAIYLGIIIVGASFIYGIYVFYYALIDQNRSGYASIVLLLLFLGGVIILILGVIGEYLARIYVEVKHRPLFIVSDSNINSLEEDTNKEI